MKALVKQLGRERAWKSDAVTTQQTSVALPSSSTPPLENWKIMCQTGKFTFQPIIFLLSPPTPLFWMLRLQVNTALSRDQVMIVINHGTRM